MTPLRFAQGVTLVGAGESAEADLAAARARAPGLVAADGGADRLARLGVAPDAVIGDLDSMQAPPAEGVPILRVAEQDSTDLEKCLRLTEAPFHLGVGFAGGRLDHTLAAFHALVAHPHKRLVLLGPEDAAFAAPLRWRARLAPGARVSIFPMTPVRALGSTGLRWPLDGLTLGAGGRIGVSNECVAAEATARFAEPGAVILLERRFLDAALHSLTEVAE